LIKGPCIVVVSVDQLNQYLIFFLFSSVRFLQVFGMQCDIGLGYYQSFKRKAFNACNKSKDCAGVEESLMIELVWFCLHAYGVFEIK
jgi:hypothetical protein